MSRTLADARRWTREGTERLLAAADGLTETALDAPSLLPGWSRRQLIAHVAANADALGNLVHWAATGEPTPMYASAEERAAGIERGAKLPADELSAWLRDSATRLEQGMTALTGGQWRHRVTTAQGREVPASEIAWLRAREVCVHGVDLDRGASFADLPDDFLESLVTDVIVKRGEVPEVAGALSQRAAWLTGRPHELTGAPELPAWL